MKGGIGSNSITGGGGSKGTENARALMVSGGGKGSSVVKGGGATSRSNKVLLGGPLTLYGDKGIGTKRFDMSPARTATPGRTVGRRM